ncbi:ryncolin-1 [Stomoxys calcitrans]|uniref:ryncolin-1 n=1 Tax=Stomoxys calcitrans TaxID=35570 RepID=UPI0027E3AD5E|nr:ryncolin-1 [Stomoxys calcitrans]
MAADFPEEENETYWGNISEIDLNTRASDFEVNKAATDIFDIRVDSLPKECQHLAIASSCSEVTECTKRSGYYNVTVLVEGYPKSYLVECDAHTDDGGWTVIQRRQDGSVDFYRPWNDYKYGFGDIEGEFFIGLEKLYALTNFHGPQELLILMENVTLTPENRIISAHAKYNSFAIGCETEKYVLKRIGKYSGTAGDSLQYHVGYKFTTKDQDNDSRPGENCAITYSGAWWYKNCYQSNLNGIYGSKDNILSGINWKTWMGYNASLNYVQMMIRRRRI